MIISRRLRWAEHVGHMGKNRGACTVLMGNPRNGDNSEDSGMDWRIILKWILQKWDGWHGLD